MEGRTAYENLEEYCNGFKKDGNIPTRNQRDWCFGAIDWAFSFGLINYEEYRCLLDLQGSLIG